MHVIENTETIFCRNCEDWVKEKSNVYSQGWTLFDQDGFLRTEMCKWIDKNSRRTN